MKWLFYFLLFILPCISFSQVDDSPKNGIGVNLVHDSNGGLATSLRYTRQLKNRGILKFEFKTNANAGYAGRIGYEFLQLRKDKFELGIGLDLKYEFEKLSKFGQPNYSELALELPIELRYHISPKYSIQAGISFPKRLSNSTNDFNYKPESVPEIRLGFNRRF